MKQHITLVWFKRDLRIQDHKPLYTAVQNGAVLPLYIIEPSVIHAPDYDRRHYDFTVDCLIDLREQLRERGQPLIVRVGEVLDIFADLQEQFDIHAIHAHEETGNALTYDRDKSVIRWCREQNIPLIETPNNGVIRPLRDRDKRRDLWFEQISQPITPTPQKLIPLDIDVGDIPAWNALGICDEGILSREVGGEIEAHHVLYTFLQSRGATYHKDMSSPLTAPDSCSRLSAHLAYGTLSERQVYWALRDRRESLYIMPADMYASLDGNFKLAMQAFESRIAWRDHFIQKLEDEPRIEFESFVPQYDSLRDDPVINPNAQQRWDALVAGKTGFPMIDACVRYLRANGWINFRMRAMLMSFATYHLWIKWQVVAVWLARLFTDYEPGIHYSQAQMQSGATGINPLRVYSPIKQAQDQDPDGIFVRAWVSELAHVPKEYIHEPHIMPPLTQLEAHCTIGKDYPAPIVDHKKVAKSAKDAIWELRQRPDVKAEAQKVLARHGSRRGPRRFGTKV